MAPQDVYVAIKKQMTIQPYVLLAEVIRYIKHIAHMQNDYINKKTILMKNNYFKPFNYRRKSYNLKTREMTNRLVSRGL